MNVYDFDETIFSGDCEIRFFKWIGENKGFGFYSRLFKVLEFLTKKHHLFSRRTARQIEYSFLKKVDDIDSMTEEFWDYAIQFVKPWYWAAKLPNDVIATGSPEFLLKGAMKRLGLNGLVCTDMNKHTGKINGAFVIGEHKVPAFKAKFGNAQIDNFYSDSYSDHFLADISKNAFVVLPDDSFRPWKEYFSKLRQN